MRIIIVDDHVLFREGLASMFRSEPDFEITGLAGSVQEAINLARSMKPEIILMDFSLTDGTGVDATRQILAEQPECKIIFLTMSEQDEHLLAAVRAGAKGYLLKDMRPSRLAAALRSVYHGESAISRSMTLRLMDELTRTRPIDPPANATLESLTAREIDVLRKIAVSKSNQDIAAELFISENTVKYHVHSILGKLGLTDRKEAGQYARENQI